MGYSLILNTYDKITSDICEIPIGAVSYTHLTLPTT